MQDHEGSSDKAWQRLAAWFESAAPSHVRDAIVVEQYRRIGAQKPLLYLTIASTAFAAGMASQGNFPAFYRYVIPLLVILHCAVRAISWLRLERGVIDPQTARKQLRMSIGAIAASTSLATMCTLSAYFQTDQSIRSLESVVLVLGLLAVTNCHASLPQAAITPMLFGNLPVALVMMTSGDPHGLAVGLAIAMVSLMHVQLIYRRYREMVENLTLQHEMRELANTDALTGLHNRRFFLEQLDAQIAAAAEGSGPTIAMLDLDGFKLVNDQHGHAAGDELLCQVGDRLRIACPDDLIVARIGGDEFAILMLAGSDVLPTDLASVALSALTRPFTLAAGLVRVGASLGLSNYPHDGVTGSALLAFADAALYAVKAERGRRKSDKRLSPVKIAA